MTHIQTDSTYTVCYLGVSYLAGYGDEITLLDAECTLGKHSSLQSSESYKCIFLSLPVAPLTK